MDDKTLVERLRENVFYGDAHSFNFEQHNPLAMKAADTIVAQATRIEALEAALRKIEGQAVCVAMPATEDEMRDWLQNILEAAQQALESKP